MLGAAEVAGGGGREGALPGTLPDGHPASEHHFPRSPTVEDIMSRLLQLEHGRQAMVDALWASLASRIYERGFVNGTTLVVNPQTSGMALISSVVASVPAGQTGVLTLGDLQISLPAGLNVMGETGFLLSFSDLRQLVVTGGGSPLISLALAGVQLPTRGVLAK